MGARGRWFIALLLLGALAVSACSASIGGKNYDASKVEDFLVKSQEGKIGGLTLGKATCPKDVKIVEGVTFTCTLVIADADAPYKVTITNVDKDKANIHAAPAKALISVAAANAFVQKNLKDSAAGATVDCSEGGQKLIISDPGDKIACKVSLGGQSDTVDLLVKDTKGNIVIAP